MSGTIALLLLGLVLLFAGGEALVRGAVSLAVRLGLSPFVVGITVVGFGTSTPELLVSIQAALVGSPDIATGNIVGSNSANILLILGLSACLAPMAVKINDLSRDLLVMIGAAFAMLALGFLGYIDRLLGFGMVTVLAGYLIYVVKFAPRPDLPLDNGLVTMAAWKVALFIVGGLGALMVGASLLVDASTTIARSFGISETVIGLTIVAVGTSLPELATSVIAAFRRNSEIAVGNVIGSNIFNIFGILGVTAVVMPVTIATQMAKVDIPLMLLFSVALAVAAYALGRFNRIIGVAFLGTYGLYLAYLF